jgi:hypothetical protein
MHRYLLALAALAVALALPAAGSGHGTFTLSALGTATIDGQLSPGEWPATGVTIRLLFGGAATIYAMNDGTTLYLAAQLPTASSLEKVVFSFDNDHDGSGVRTEVGDDELTWESGPGVSCPAGCDQFFNGLTIPLDTEAAGTHDLTLARAAADGTTTVEFAHPLDSADDAHDFSLASGDTVTMEAFVVSGSNGGSNGGVVLGDITISQPLAVTMAGLSARPARDGVLVRWRTGSELDFLGFHVYRSRGQSWRRLTRTLIPARGSVAGASYRYLDRRARRGATYRYRIQAVNLDGSRQWFGPVRVRVPR